MRRTRAKTYNTADLVPLETGENYDEEEANEIELEVSLADH